MTPEMVAWTCPECGRQFGRNRQSHECSPAMTDIHRMIKYRHCEQEFIFGPQGHSDGKK